MVQSPVWVDQVMQVTAKLHGYREAGKTGKIRVTLEPRGVEGRKRILCHLDWTKYQELRSLTEFVASDTQVIFHSESNELRQKEEWATRKRERERKSSRSKDNHIVSQFRFLLFAHPSDWTVRWTKEWRTQWHPQQRMNQVRWERKRSLQSFTLGTSLFLLKLLQPF